MQRHPRLFRKGLALGLTATLLATSALAQPADALRAGFAAPGQAARPYVWWHWMNGNVTIEGIAKDMEWFSKIGVGGMTAFDGAGAVPPFVQKRLVYMHDDWKEAFRFAMAEADKRGLEASIAASPGWSQTGGPWVKPEQAMKKYVWTETWVEGGRRFNGKLAQPSDTAGAFQDAAVNTRSKPPAFYRDAKIFAYRVDAQARSQADLAPVITTSAAFEANGSALAQTNGAVRLDAARLSNGKVTDPIYLAPATFERPAQIDVAYAQPVTRRGIALANGEAFAPGWRPEAGPLVRIEASPDGASFRTVAEGLYTGGQRTFAFPATTAKVFRVSILPSTPPVVPRAFGAPRSPTQPGQVKQAGAPAPPVPAGGEFGGGGGQAGRPSGFALAELTLRQVAPVEQFEVKAGFGVVNDYYAIPTADTGGAVRARDVVDLTGRMAADGTLDWQAPAGRWVVVRLGYGLTGKENGPASEEATGLEVDKLNAEHVRTYVNHYLDMYASATGPELIGKRGLRAILNDSYEARFQNWTENMLGEFQTRRGYDPGPYLPVLTGVVVESAEKSDRFLWDWRRTIFELMAKSHYKVVAEEARKRGMIAYAEALEDNRAYHGDDMEMRQYADVPMSAIGLGGSDEGVEPLRRRQADSRGAASVAHIYGKKIVASETFTGAAADRSPQQLKSLSDEIFVQGVNRIFVHTSAHQPLDMGPGSTLNNIGFFFTRNEPWADMAKAWTDYLARTSYMLQQGDYVADYAYFYGEEAPITGIWGADTDKALPMGRGFDFVNADALLNQLSLQTDGSVGTPSGMKYRLIYIGGRSSQMTLPVLNKLKTLVEQGAVIAGEKPKRSPSLADDDAAFQKAADALWGSGEPGLRLVGRGRVFVGFTADDALTRMGLFPDVDYAVEPINAPLGSIHRKLADGDLYYVANRRAYGVNLELSFRNAGRDVEFWDPVSGQITPASYRTVNGRTIVPMAMAPADSVFVVMRGSGPPARTVPAAQTRVAQVLDGAWKVAFQANRGAPSEITLPGLMSLSEHQAPGVRYFSGVATYSRTVDLAAAPSAGQSYLLDLGKVEDMARVYVNDVEIGTVWRPPFRVDITRALKPGANSVRVEVANTWKNRLIGDQQPGMTQVTFAPSAAERPDTPLIASGLLGPVQLIEKR